MKEIKSSHRGKREILLQKRAVGFTLTPSESMKVLKSKIHESMKVMKSKIHELMKVVKSKIHESMKVMKSKIHESMKAMKSITATKFSRPKNQ